MKWQLIVEETPVQLVVILDFLYFVGPAGHTEVDGEAMKLHARHRHCLSLEFSVGTHGFSRGSFGEQNILIGR